MNILGINTGLGASICLLSNGQVIFAVEEERLTRIKNCGGFPKKSLQMALELFPSEMQDLESIGICDYENQAITIDDLLDRYKHRFEKRPSALSPYWLRKKLSDYTKRKQQIIKDHPDLVAETRNALSELEIKDQVFRRLKHHKCHAAAAYYGLAVDKKKYLIFTLDGGGDRECGSVSIAENGKITQICSTPSHYSVGGIYSAITYLMGFKPHEHEYKIMGLAPYTQGHYGQDVYEKLNKILYLDGMNFRSSIDEKLGNAGTLYTELFKYERFDNMASGLQKFTEDLVCQWIKNAIKETGISDILLSGGVFMNVKVNQQIAKLPQVTSVDCFPSCGDETNAFGIAYQLHADKSSTSGGMLNAFCLGPTPIKKDEFDIGSVSKEFCAQELKNPEERIAQLVASGHIVARCAGPMEFGARALGNRSLIADPTAPGVVDRLNHMIKQRDFWMPFAPAIRLEDAHKYLKIPETLPKHLSRYMMFGFETNQKLRDELSGSLHRADKTARAQVVDRRIYPAFHKIITQFKKITGRGVVLNTSFNLHGLPIVAVFDDALHVLRNSDLNYLIVENFLITKKFKKAATGEYKSTD